MDMCHVTHAINLSFMELMSQKLVETKKVAPPKNQWDNFRPIIFQMEKTPPIGLNEYFACLRHYSTLWQCAKEYEYNDGCNPSL